MSAGDWTCVCGRAFGKRGSLMVHGRTCDAEKARSRSLVRAIESGNWHSYATRYSAGGCSCACHLTPGRKLDPDGKPHKCGSAAALGGDAR